jgi:hypothetical protein
MFPYETQLLPGGYVDRSGKIATGGTSQLLMSSNSARRRLIVQNPATTTSQGIGATENLYINFGNTASGSTGASIELLAGGSYDSDSGPCTTDAVYVVAATTNHQYFAKEMV